jgi:hypothetical protein
MSRYRCYPAKVLGCLRNGEITLILCPGIGLADGGQRSEIPIHAVPVDLRIPNSEFDVLQDGVSGNFVKVLRKDETFVDDD